MSCLFGCPWKTSTYAGEHGHALRPQRLVRNLTHSYRHVQVLKCFRTVHTALALRILQGIKIQYKITISVCFIWATNPRQPAKKAPSYVRIYSDPRQVTEGNIELYATSNSFPNSITWEKFVGATFLGSSFGVVWSLSLLTKLESVMLQVLCVRFVLCLMCLLRHGWIFSLSHVFKPAGLWLLSRAPNEWLNKMLQRQPSGLLFFAPTEWQVQRWIVPAN